MLSRDEFQLVCLGQVFPRIQAYRFEETVTLRVAVKLDERLVNELRKCIENMLRKDGRNPGLLGVCCGSIISCTDNLCGLERKIAAEDACPSQDHALALGQQVVAP